MINYKVIENTVHLIKYSVTVLSGETTGRYLACSQNELEQIMDIYPNASVESVDVSGYEWLDGMTFTQEQLSAGELDKAIELGETAYTTYALASDPDVQLLEMDYRISLLELGVSENDLLSL